MVVDVVSVRGFTSQLRARGTEQVLPQRVQMIY